MRNPADLSRSELELVVAEVRDALHLEGQALDPDKCWDADTCQDVAEVLSRHDLAPDEPVRIR